MFSRNSRNALRHNVILMQNASMLTIECPQCEEEFIPGQASQTYCSSSCRQQAYRDRNQIKANPPPKVFATHRPKPVPPVQPVRVTNLGWLAQYQRCSVEEQRYRALTTKLADIQSEVSGMTEGKVTGNTGRLIGIGLAVVVMAMVYDDRKNKPIPATVLVILAALALCLPLAGNYIGCLIGKQLLATDVPAQKKLADLQKLVSETRQLVQQQEEPLNTAKAGLAVIPQYESETSAPPMESDTGHADQSVSLNDGGASNDDRHDERIWMPSGEGIVHHEAV